MHEFSTNIMNTNENVLYLELSYRLMGILFEAHNKLGTKYKEVYFRHAIESKLKQYKARFFMNEKKD